MFVIWEVNGGGIYYMRVATQGLNIHRLCVFYLGKEEVQENVCVCVCVCKKVWCCG